MPTKLKPFIFNINATYKRRNWHVRDELAIDRNQWSLNWYTIQDGLIEEAIRKTSSHIEGQIDLSDKRWSGRIKSFKMWVEGNRDYRDIILYKQEGNQLTLKKIRYNVFNVGGT